MIKLLIKSQIYVLIKTSSATHAGCQQQTHVLTTAMQTTEASFGQTHNANNRGFSWTNTQCKRETYILFPVL